MCDENVTKNYTAGATKHVGHKDCSALSAVFEIVTLIVTPLTKIKCQDDLVFYFYMLLSCA